MTPLQKSVPFTVSAAQATPQWECGEYPWVSVHVLTQGASSTVTFQTSNDGSNWVSTALGLSSATATALVTSTTSAAAIYAGPLNGRFFRLNVTGIASGITSGVVAFLPTPRALGSSGGTAVISGDVAASTTDSGNPVKIGGVYVSPPPTYTSGQRTNLHADSRGSLRVAIVGADSTSAPAVGTVGSYGVSAAAVALSTRGFGHSYNGTSWDPTSGNSDTAALITAAGATTTQTSADQTNYNGRGVRVVLDMTTVGTGSVTLTIQGKDAASGKYYTLLAGAAVITDVTNAYEVYPGVTATANVSASTALPRVWRIVTTANNANPSTYTVGASVIV